MKNWNSIFLILLVCSLGLPSIDFVYAEPIANLIESGEIITSVEDQTLDGGIIINEGGELIIDSGITLNINGAVVNSGKITIDGNLIIDGIVVNNSIINVQCGVFDTVAATIIGNDPDFITCVADPTDPTDFTEIFFDDLTVGVGESLFIPKNTIYAISGTLLIEGLLENRGTIEHKGNMLFSNPGKIKNFGTVNSFCENFEERGRNGDVNIVGPGEIIGTTCSAPVSTNDAYSINEDEILTVDVAMGVLANDSDSDTDGTDLKTKIKKEPISGTIILTSNGGFTYIPDPDYFGLDSFEYKVSDGTGGKTTGLVTLDVLPVSETPVSVSDAYNIDEDTPLEVSAAEGVLANDSDSDTDSTDLKTEIIVDPTFGTITLNSNGIFTYIPNADYFGLDSFEYKVSDDENYATSSVAIDVLAINDAPIAENGAYTTDEDTLLTISSPGVLANDADVDSINLTVVVTENPTSGVVVLENDGVFTYTPNADYFGADSFTYSVADDDGEVVTATVAITVTAVNDAPVATNDAYPVNEDDTLVVSTAEGVLTNDADVDSINLTVVVSENPTSGTITLNSDGIFTYTPNADYFGDESFEYTVSDGENEVTATVAIAITDVNDPPVISDPISITVESTGLETPLSVIGLSEPIVIDLFDSTPTITNDAPAAFPLGTTIVTWTATDSSDAFATATQLITLEDTTSPTISTPSDLIVEATGLDTLQSSVGLSEPTVTDAVDSTPTITNDAPVVFSLGDTTVIWTATDASGNSVTATQLVTVEHITLLDQKISLTQQVEDMIDDATHEYSIYELKKSTKHFTKSIDAAQWSEDKESLGNDAGNKIFYEQEKGVKHLIKVLEYGYESDEFAYNLTNILLDMVNIDQQIAENEFNNALNSPVIQKKCIGKASYELEKSKKYHKENKFEKAIDHYGKVWENSKKSQSNKKCR